MSELLGHLDPCYKESSVKIYQSSSLQCATPKAPRIVIFLNGRKDPGMDSATTRCSFNSGTKEDYTEFYDKDPTIDCHENTLECEHYTGGDEAKTEFYEVTVPHDDKGKPYHGNQIHQGSIAQVSKINPPQCMTACHRGLPRDNGPADPRPTLENYELWPGFYGSFHDELTKGKDSPLKKEMDHWSHDYYPYKALNSRYGQIVDIIDGDFNRINPDVRSRQGAKPITDLQNTLEFQNFRRIARKFTNPATRERIWPFRYALIAAITCNTDSELYNGRKPESPETPAFPIESFLPPEIKSLAGTSFQEVASSHLAEHQKNLQHLVELQRKVGPLDADFAADYEKDMANDPSAAQSTYRVRFGAEFGDIARLGYLARVLDIPDDDWSLSFRYTHDFGAGAQNTREITKFLLPKLLDEEKDKELGTFDLDALAHYGGASTEQCNQLRKKSLETLTAALKENKIKLASEFRTKPKAPHEAAASQLTSAKSGCKIPEAPKAVAECIRCHVHGQERYFPLEHPPTLTARLRQPADKKQSKPLLELFKEQIRSGKMPYNRAIPEAEKEELINYFSTLSTLSCFSRIRQVQ